MSDAGLAARAQALAEAVQAGRGRLPSEMTDRAEQVLHLATERLALSGEHTAVAIAGATGSGKSSLLNALVGAEVAEVGVRRPTTDRPVAVVVPGPGDAHPLLDWLGVDRRTEVGGLPGQAAATGLVLLDLPDHDSVVTEHRALAERLQQRVDLLVWVLDPQKYADAAVHDRYLRPMAGHAAVTVLVLNQVDRLTPEQREACLADLRRLAAADGLGAAPVLAVSATTGDGVPRLRGLLAEAAGRRRAATDRFGADLRAAAVDLLAACGPDSPPRRLRTARQELLDAAEVAAGVPVLLDATARAAVRGARAATGWPPTRWLARLRPDPLRRLGLAADRVPPGDEAVARSSLPPAGPAARSGLAVAVRGYLEVATAGAPDAWVLAARSAVTGPERLDDAMDGAVARVRLGDAPRPRWWRVIGAAQWVVLWAAVAGLAWLGVLALLAYLRLPEPSTPVWWGLPAPTVLAVGGVLAGVLLAVVGRGLGAVTARRRVARARRALRTGLGEVVEAAVVEPVAGELAALRACRHAAARAAG